MADQRKGVKTRRSLFTSPLSVVKEPKKAKTVSEIGSDSDEVEAEMEMEGGRGQRRGAGVGAKPLMDVSAVHEIIITRVNEALSVFKPADGAEADPVMRAIPVIATAVAVAVGEVMRSMMKEVEERLRPISSPKEDRLFSAVRSLTYENDRLQQYSRRESVRIVGIPSSPGETAEEVEQKALKVFNDAGAAVKREDIAVSHRAGKERNGSRPILVKFVSRRTRNEVSVKKKNLKGKDGYQRVYVNDDLTMLRARLLAYVKKLPCVGKAWTVDGRINCVKRSPPGLAPTDRPRPVVIETPDDLFKLGLDRVDYTALGLRHLAEDDGGDQR